MVLLSSFVFLGVLLVFLCVGLKASNDTIGYTLGNTIRTERFGMETQRMAEISDYQGLWGYSIG